MLLSSLFSCSHYVFRRLPVQGSEKSGFISKRSRSCLRVKRIKILFSYDEFENISLNIILAQLDLYSPFIHKRFLCLFLQQFTAAVALWLESSLREQEVVGSILGRNKVFKTGSSGFPLGPLGYGNSTLTGPPVSG